MHIRMENMHRARHLNLNKRVKLSLFQSRMDKRLSQIIPVFKEIKDASIDIKHHSNNAVLLENAKRWWVLLVELITFVVIPPFLIPVLVTCLKVQAPDVWLSRKVLVDHKIIPADTYTNSWILGPLWDLVYPVLEIIFVTLL